MRSPFLNLPTTGILLDSRLSKTVLSGLYYVDYKSLPRTSKVAPRHSRHLLKSWVWILSENCLYEVSAQLVLILNSACNTIRYYNIAMSVFLRQGRCSGDHEDILLRRPK